MTTLIGANTSLVIHLFTPIHFMGVCFVADRGKALVIEYSVRPRNTGLIHFVHSFLTKPPLLP